MPESTSKLVLGTSTRSRSRPKLFSGSRPKKYPITNHSRSRPELDDRVVIFWVATRSKILDCFHRAVYPGKFSEKFLGRDPKNFLGRDRNIRLSQTCSESHFFQEKSSQVTQKSSHDFDFFQNPKKVKVMTLT
jgi:hypothetical protein